MMKIYVAAATMAVASIGYGEPGSLPVETLAEFVDGPARVVWMQQREGGNDPHGWLNHHVLRVAESNSDVGSRELIHPPFHVHRPIITPGGTQVVFSSYETRSCYVVDWNGAGLRELGNGYALDVWTNPETGVEWVYTTTTGAENWERQRGSPVVRFPLDRPENREMVWNRTAITINNFMLSRDGELACAQFPHPHGGFARLSGNEWQSVARGCWTSLAPDNSYLMWVFDGPHRNLIMYSIRENRRWTVRANTAPGMAPYEVYHPRWSNHPRYFAITGPYKEGKHGDNLIGAGGGAVELYLGKFDPHFEEVESWCRLTRNEVGDFYPDLWIENGDRAPGYAPSTRVTDNPRERAWPPSKRNAVLLWESAAVHHAVPDKAGSGSMTYTVRPSGNAIFDRFHGMQVGDGYFDASGFDAGTLVPEADWTFELTFSPAQSDLGSRIGCIASFGKGNGTSIALVQREQAVFLQPRILPAGSQGPELLVLSEVDSAKTYHLVVTMGHGQLRTFLDGVPGKAITLPVPIVSTAPPHFRIGDGPEGDSPWPGTVEAVGLYAESMSEGRALRHAAAAMTRTEGRAAIDSFQVTARLLHPVNPPGSDDIGVYRRALVVSEYMVESGDAFSGERILVVEWAVLDATSVLSPWKTGSRREFLLESFDDHPELEGERRFTQHESDPFELSMFYRVGPPEGAGLR
jgi:hypothetical protein